MAKDLREAGINAKARRRDQRKSSGLSSEAEWKNYLIKVQKKGLKDCDSLDERITMLRRAAAGDSQVLYVSHLSSPPASIGTTSNTTSDRRVEDIPAQRI